MWCCTSLLIWRKGNDFPLFLITSGLVIFNHSFSVSKSSFLWLIAALCWSSQQLLSDSTILILCMKCMFVDFQKEKATKFGQEPKGWFKLNGIKVYLTEHSKIIIISYRTHWPQVSFFFKLKAQITIFGCQLPSLLRNKLKAQLSACIGMLVATLHQWGEHKYCSLSPACISWRKQEVWQEGDRDSPKGSSHVGRSHKEHEEHYELFKTLNTPLYSFVMRADTGKAVEWCEICTF